MSINFTFFKCKLCRKKLPKDPAYVVINGGKKLRICHECEKILELSNQAAHPEKEDDKSI